MSHRGSGVIARFADVLDVDDETPRITLGEGGTPLVRAPRLAAAHDVAEVHLKLELTNPTGSFKDRGMCVAVARALQSGATTLLCASTGNTSASAAAFAAMAGLRCIVVVPDGHIAAGKLIQARATGAIIVQIDGSFDAGLDAVRELAAEPGMALVNSVNPYRIEGQKTAAYELVEDLGGRAPDWLCVPVGNAGNITAYWRGFRELHAAGVIDTMPRLLGVQAAGAAPLVDGAPVEHPETIATAIRIGRPARGEQALTAIAESSGAILARSDEQILDAYRRIPALSGCFCEPASAVAVAGLEHARATGIIEHDATVACVLTGHGLKDPQTAASTLVSNMLRCGARAGAIMDVIRAS